MRYIKVTGDGRGGSKFEDVEVSQSPAPFAENVPPLLVSTPIPTGAVVFVTTPDDLREMAPHPAPRRQFVVVLEGEIEMETTDGEKRSFVPGVVGVLEDVEGRGHISVVRGGAATFMAIPLAS
jgi:hypothetical protein